MESIVVERSFDSDLDSLVERCRRLESRSLWPGATPDAELPDTLYYTLGIRLKAAELTDMAVEEKVGPVERDGDVTAFRCAHRCTWPDLVVDASSEYRFTAGQPNRVTLVYSYENPGPKVVKPKNLGEFRQALEKVIGRYLDRIVGASVPPAPVS